MKNFDLYIIKMVIEEPSLYKKNKNILKKLKFPNKNLQFIFQNIIEFYNSYNKTPDYDFLKSKIQIELPDKEGTLLRMMFDMLDTIQSLELSEGDRLYVMDNIKYRLEEMLITKVGNEIHNMKKDDLHTQLKEIENLQKDEYEYEIKHLWDYDEEIEREVIPTGVKMIDENGGVGRGEIGIMLASTGVGKSVFLSYMANQLMLFGNKVLHIVFEGATNDYIRLHRVKLGNPSNDLLKRGKTTKNLKVVKMHSGKTSLSDIQDFLEILKDEGFVPDAICLDYLDLLAPTKVRKEMWMSEINTSNELEEFCWRNNIVFWTAVQTNRSGLNNEIPTLSQIGGSVSKAQKATMVLAVSRTNQQIDGNTADVAIRKNRYGKTCEAHNIEWNPDKMVINIEQNDDITL